MERVRSITRIAGKKDTPVSMSKEGMGRGAE